ncbi:ig-like domain-containing protein [Trichonephila clavipes]|nr:ig-like domain-containing protein [Trichonephila clavipes]
MSQDVTFLPEHRSGKAGKGLKKYINTLRQRWAIRILKELPKVYVMPEKLIMNESQSADLICSSSGDPPIILYWDTSSLVSNHTVGDFEFSGLISSDYENGSLERFNFSFDANSSLQILSISVSHGTDNGFVSCIAENDVGQEIAEVSLEIHVNYQVQGGKCAQWARYRIWQACNEFEPSTTRDPPCRGAMHVKSVESSNGLSLVWCSS